ncbi:hypothetical protein [Vibrio sp. B1FLJ16]|uniref:hypothetical protein n=1 Tax=Vibrio sp. B1FLJ16 TaxID=2751178 RepID=UPI0015F733C3|nr:hypothetical protein [Vibrio sp. B1FLJ16]CAD7822380.1 hypothetical protein ACOMICROBIO_EPCKBFOG_04213 [Vibrio sp. B1FLJ16]CAE6948911.1 hypothetical protein ACOMICROBIO_EPCKBFOG_04213 [Vibrio sp. B1FLJ16]
MSVSHTNTLEINNDAGPAEAPEAESSPPLNQFDDSVLSTTEATDTEEPEVIADQTAKVTSTASEISESVGQYSGMDTQTTLPVTTSEADQSTSISDIAANDSVRTETKTEATLLETHSTKAKETKITDLVAVNESEHHYPEKSISASSGESRTIKDHALNEALTTPSVDTVAVTETPTQFDFHLPFSTDWLMVLVFFLTTVFLFLTNRRQIKKAAQLAQSTSQPLMPMQQPTVDVEFEKAKVVAESRQKWMHSLREEVANFVSATNAIWDLHKIKDGCEDILTDMNDPQFVMKELYHWSCTYNKAVQDTEQLYTKIHLLINPKEEKAQTLSKLLDRTMIAVEAKKSPSKINDDIIAITQEILKDEWERVKTFG